MAYAVAAQLGFKPTQVKWAYEPFDSSYAPGPKTFDFDINEISLQRRSGPQVVTFSDQLLRRPASAGGPEEQPDRD